MQKKRFWWIAAAIAVLGIYLVYRYNFIDFQVYYYAGRSLLAGRTDLYAPDFASSTVLDYRYPPLFILLFAPISLLPFGLAEYVWYLICAAAIGGCFYTIKKIIDYAAPEWTQHKWLIRGLTILAVGQYFVMALKYGNVHLLVTLLLFGAFYLLMREKDGWAALLMSLAVTVKLIPVIALPYFAIKKRWNFLWLTALFIVVLNFVPSFYFGVGKNAELLKGWYEHVVVNQDAHEKDSWINLSLKGLLRRYTVEIDYSKRAAGSDNSDTEYRQVNLLALPENVASRIWLITSGMIYAICLALIYFSGKRRAEDDFALAENADLKRILIEYSLLVCLILFVGPLTPKLYFIKMLLPFACLSAIAFSAESAANRVSRFILILIAIAGFVFPLLPGRAVQRFMLVIGTDFYLLCLLMIAAVTLLFTEKSSAGNTLSSKEISPSSQHPAQAN